MNTTTRNPLSTVEDLSSGGVGFVDSVHQGRSRLTLSVEGPRYIKGGRVKYPVSRHPLLDLEDIPEEYHDLFTEEYLGDRHIFRVWAHNPEVLEATLEYLDVLYGEPGERRKELVILTVARARGARYA